MKVVVSNLSFRGGTSPGEEAVKTGSVHLNHFLISDFNYLYSAVGYIKE